MKKREIDQFQKVDKLIQAIEGVYPSTKVLVWKSFLRGIFFRIRVRHYGVSIVLAMLGFVITGLSELPFLREIILQMQIEDVLR
jgi:hypothetical protein